MEIEAAVVREESGTFQIESLDLEAEPRPGEVRVRIVGAGICHTDLLVRDQDVPTPLPAVLGHEGSGIVEEVGEGVTKVSPGDRVVLTFTYDDSCEMCRSGQVALCENVMDLNFAGRRLSDGSTPITDDDDDDISGMFFAQSSFATHAIATEQNVVPVGEDIPLELLGPLGCGVQTGAGGVINVLDPQAGSSIVIFGAGSVGLSGVMAADLKGCTDIVVVEPFESRRSKATDLGATETLDPGEVDVVDKIRSHLGTGAEYSLETSGNTDVLRQAVDCLGHGGTCGIIGAPPAGSEVSLDVSHMLLGRSVTGITEGNVNPDLFIPDLIDLYRRGKFPFDELVTYYDFHEIQEAVEDQEAGEVIKPILRVSEP